jgi:Methyltransferase domain
MPLACPVCDGRLTPHCTKDFRGENGLGDVHYERCTQCGLVISRTHYELDDDAWEALNAEYHKAYLGTDVNLDDPRWMDRLAHQAALLPKLTGITPAGLPWLDYGAGDGQLADMVAAAGAPMRKYDRYLPLGADGFLDEDELVPGGFGLVITTSVFEHVRGVEPLDEVNRLVADADGVMALHTLVRGEVPADPHWFYFLPVHCTFFTNRSLEVLVDRWGYTASSYHVDARLWCLTRLAEDELRDRLAAAGAPDDTHVSSGFMAYWP